MMRLLTVPRGMALLAAVVVGGCAYEVGYEPAFVPEERPDYVADGRLLIVMPEAQRELVYEGAPASEVGSFTTMTIPFGTIMQDIARDVFGSCFARGVEFADSREQASSDYVVALEGDMQDFLYSYTRVIDEGFSVSEPTTWLVPEVHMHLNVRAFDPSDRLLLEKTYDSGVVAGSSYYVDSRPAQRVNEALHATLHSLMLQVAEDVRPLITGSCDIRDLS
jgi:hypothetical protein